MNETHEVSIDSDLGGVQVYVNFQDGKRLFLSALRFSEVDFELEASAAWIGRVILLATGASERLK